MEKQSDKRMLVIAALAFGLVAIAVSVRWLNTGEIVIRRDTTDNVQSNNEGPVVGRIKSDQALFYAVCATWALYGVSMLVLPPVAYFGNDEFLMKLSGYGLAAILPLGLGTVFVAWLAG